MNGVTAAGGLELLLSCDFAIAAQSSRIGDAHLQYGQMGGGGVLTMLPRMIGPSRARQLIFSGRFLTADEACDWGLVSSVVPDADLLEAGLEFSRGVATRSPLAVANAKFVLNTAWSDGTGMESAPSRTRADRLLLAHGTRLPRRSECLPRQAPSGVPRQRRAVSRPA